MEVMIPFVSTYRLDSKGIDVSMKNVWVCILRDTSIRITYTYTHHAMNQVQISKGKIHYIREQCRINLKARHGYYYIPHRIGIKGQDFPFLVDHTTHTHERNNSPRSHQIQTHRDTHYKSTPPSLPPKHTLQSHWCIVQINLNNIIGYTYIWIKIRSFSSIYSLFIL